MVQNLGAEVAPDAVIDVNLDALGLTLQLPNRKPPAGLQQLPLEGFPSIHIGVLWRGRPTPLAEALIQLLRQHAQSL